MPFEIPFFDMDTFVRATLAEDLGPTGKDVTSESVIPADVRFDGVDGQPRLPSPSLACQSQSHFSKR